MKPSFVIVGCGRVGTALGLFLSRLGYRPAGTASLSLNSAEDLAKKIDTPNFSNRPWDITQGGDIVFITTPDDVIEPVCKEISSAGGFHADNIVVHCSGSLPSTLLNSARASGAKIASMHPLQSFASTRFEKNPFEHIIMSIEGEEEAVEKTEAVARDLGAQPIRILTEAKMLYHASAVVASNYLVSLLDLAFQLIGKAGIEPQKAYEVLSPLIRGTLANVERIGIPKALTGPIARGDVRTVEHHLREIGRQAPDLLPLFIQLGRHTVDVAEAKEELSSDAIEALRKAFE